VNSLKLLEKLTIFADLARLKLSVAVTLSAVTGYFIFTVKAELPLLCLIPGVFLLAAGASALNQFDEKNQDIIMGRTSSRPLPLGKMKPVTALSLSVLLLITGIGLLMTIGVIPALLGVLNIILYNLVYTRLKRITSLAIIPGAAVGAIPPLIGFTAAGGFVPQTEIILFSAFMFLWQLPHFWLILVKYRNEYQKAGFKTFPKQMEEKQIKHLIFMWVLFSTALLLAFILASVALNPYLITLLIPLNILFIYLFYRMLYKHSENIATRGAFILVNSFGLLIMSLFIINAFL
jgi:protoheme IX farnesyltransferase